MKTKAPIPADASHGSPPTGTQSASPNLFGDLVQRKVKRRSSTVPDSLPIPTELQAPPAGGVVLGVLSRLDEMGAALVSAPAFGLDHQPAMSLVPVTTGHLGQTVVLGFEAGDVQRPILLGFLVQPGVAPAAEPIANAPVVRQEGQRVVIEAQGELELRCGEAVILLGQDGHVHIRGAYVTSHASASHRIRGGAVQIN